MDTRDGARRDASGEPRGQGATLSTLSLRALAHAPDTAFIAMDWNPVTFAEGAAWSAALAAGLAAAGVRRGDRVAMLSTNRVAKIMEKAPLSIALTKVALETGVQSDLATCMALETASTNACFLTEDAKEGARAFVEKRPPRYQGR